jgi:hypothetical protein
MVLMNTVKFAGQDFSIFSSGGHLSSKSELAGNVHTYGWNWSFL